MEPYLEVIPNTEVERITNILDQSKHMDIFFHPNYVRMLGEYGFSHSEFLLYNSDDGQILDPILYKEIPGAKGYYDAHSPWFYGGPLIFIDDDNIRSNYVKFQELYKEHFKKNKVVAEFKRFHPILTNDHIKSLPQEDVFYEKKIIYVDLEKDIETIFEGYSKKVKKGIRKGKQAELEFVISQDLENDIQIFKDQYLGRMKEMGASSFYQFNDDFFSNLVKYFKDNMGVFFIKKDDRIIAGKLSIYYNGFLNGFIGYADPRYHHFRTNDLFYHMMNVWAKDQGFKYYTLGGGKSGSEDDSIFKYKIQFSTDYFKQYCTKTIFDHDMYEKICFQKGMKSLSCNRATYFPEYREPL